MNIENVYHPCKNSPLVSINCMQRFALLMRVNQEEWICWCLCQEHAMGSLLCSGSCLSSRGTAPLGLLYVFRQLSSASGWRLSWTSQLPRCTRGSSDTRKHLERTHQHQCTVWPSLGFLLGTCPFVSDLYECMHAFKFFIHQNFQLSVMD